MLSRPARTASTRAPTHHDGSLPSARWRAPRWVVVAAGAAIVAAMGIAIVLYVRTLDPYYDQSDLAVLAIYTKLALQGDLQVGPYSRFFWHHPGPLYFLALAPLYWLTDYHLHSLAWTAALINLGAVWLLLDRLYRRGGFGLFAAGSVLTLFFLLQLDGLVTSAWNPHVTVLPLATLVVLCADLASTTRLRPLPPIVLFGSFLAQTHVGYVPCVGALVASSVALHVRLRWAAGSAPSDERSSVLPYLLTSVAVLTVVWAPPLAENLRNDPGNLTFLYRYFRSQAPPQGLDAVGVFVHTMTALPMRRLELGWGLGAASNLGWAAVGLTMAQLLLLAPVSWWARRRGRDFHSALCLLSLVGSLVALWSVTRIVGPILAHLVFWVSVFSLTNITALLAVLPCLGRDALEARRTVPVAPRARAWPRLLPAALVVIAATYYLPRLADAQRRSGPGSLAVETLASEFRSHVIQYDVERPLLAIPPRSWGVAAGVILERLKEGQTVAVTPRWVFMFTDVFAADGSEDARFEIVDDPRDDLRYRLDYEPVARGGDHTIYRQYRLEASRRLSDPGRILGTSGTRGDPEQIVSGRLLEEGSDWNAEGTLLFDGADSSVTLSVPAKATGLALLADSNDTWRLECSRDGSTFEFVGLIPFTNGHGLRTREMHLRGLTNCSHLRIFPQDGDGMFSIGAVTFLSAAVNYREGQ